MQNRYGEIYGKTQRAVLRLLVYILALCVCCAFIAGVQNAFGEANTHEQLKSSNSFERASGRLATCSVDNKTYVRIGGYPIGISIRADGLIVVSTCAVTTIDGAISPSEASNIRAGDIIKSINGERLQSIYRLKELLSKSQDGIFKVEGSRDGKDYSTIVYAAKDKSDGTYKLGLSLKEDVGGVGTMTFVSQEGKFAALGHHIQDSDTLIDDELSCGSIYNAEVSGVIRGERGRAGGLVADVNRLQKSIGSIKKNTQIGLYGDYSADASGELYRIAMKGEAKIGKAQVLTTIDGTEPKLYDIEIVKVISQDAAAQKGMVVSVSDKELLQKTGGIVQGMSGSPILQNGILVGAITHVFVQDPTRGYAVHSRFMYDMLSDLDSESYIRSSSSSIAA